MDTSNVQKKKKTFIQNAQRQLKDLVVTCQKANNFALN